MPNLTTEELRKHLEAVVPQNAINQIPYHTMQDGLKDMSEALNSQPQQAGFIGRGRT